jgi:hypothetical protein
VKEINGNKNVNNNGGYTPGLLGIAAETVPDWELVLNKTETFGFPPKTISVMTTANLGIVFRADMISETLDATGCPKTQRKGQTEY